MNKCQELFEQRHKFTVCENMDIQTAVAWENWCNAWNAAIHAAAHECDRLRVNGKGIRGQVSRAAMIAFNDVMALEHRGVSAPEKQK